MRKRPTSSSIMQSGHSHVYPYLVPHVRGSLCNLGPLFHLAHCPLSRRPTSSCTRPGAIPCYCIIWHRAALSSLALSSLAQCLIWPFWSLSILSFRALGALCRRPLFQHKKWWPSLSVSLRFCRICSEPCLALSPAQEAHFIKHKAGKGPQREALGQHTSAKGGWEGMWVEGL